MGLSGMKHLLLSFVSVISSQQTNYTVFHKKGPLFVFFHNSLK